MLLHLAVFWSHLFYIICIFNLLEEQEMAGMNRLKNEKSPYLLQHVNNPVDWYAWGDEPFLRANKEKKPVFLSIGYSTCHWCHVMEHESFENTEIAEILNRDFISIKVDREERPDVDRYYMDLAVRAGWGGGWPLSIWLTPDRKPFFGGTYFPPESRQGMNGFKDILLALNRAWVEQREAIVENADELIADASKDKKSAESRTLPGHRVLDIASEQLSRVYDQTFHGFGSRPKFPMPVYHDFLLGYSRVKPDSDALQMCTQTLLAMIRGGIYDQVGYGFHRYSTDARWHVPHFEKMLYDNAQLVENLVCAWQITGNPEFKNTAQEILCYVAQEMTAENNGFYSAQDADSKDPTTGEKSEGAFYLWTIDEIYSLLGQNAELFCLVHGVEENGNAVEDPFEEFRHKNILYMANQVSEVAAKFNLSEDTVQSRLADCRELLLKTRSKRPRPALDDKIIVSWNALMISALACAGRAFGNQEYVKAAVGAAEFIRKKMVDADTGILCRYWRNGPSLAPGNGEDYVFLCRAALDLYEVTFDRKWIRFAVAMDNTARKEFFDPRQGVYFMNSRNDQNKGISPAYAEDNVIPSANSIGLENQLRLKVIAEDRGHDHVAEKILSAQAENLSENPTAYARMLNALQQYLSPVVCVGIAGNPESTDTQHLIAEVNRRYIPNLVITLNSAEDSTQDEFFSFAEKNTPVDGNAAAYVCAGHECRLPVTEPEKLSKILDEFTN